MTGQQVSPYRIGGTIHSMSPEQARGLAIDARAAHQALFAVRKHAEPDAPFARRRARRGRGARRAAGTDERSRR